ncbi:MAG: hypothetical protein HY081_00835 [Gammaproteobacteria bacterium]|nr:hypothetical protein [Gammaproteobacteria bacterium]
MLRWFRSHSKSLARGMIAAMASLWLVAIAAPCVMAQAPQMDYGATRCHMPMTQADMNNCDPVSAVSCQLPDINSPLIAALGDIPYTPVLLSTLPAAFIFPETRQHPPQDFYNPNISLPPLHIRHLTLIL